MDALLKAVGKDECDLTDKWVGLQCLVEVGVCDECVVKGLQGYLLNSADPSCRKQAGELMARLSDRTVRLMRSVFHNIVDFSFYSLWSMHC